MREKHIVGLDLGTTKIACIVAQVGDTGAAEVVGVGITPSHGLRRGVVTDLEEAADSIRAAVDEAEHGAGIKVEEVYTGIAGDHIRSMNSKGVVAISRPNREITQDDINRVIEQAKAISIPLDREIVHIIPQEFIVDDERGIRNPAGMAGMKLEVEVHIVTGAATSALNIYKSVEKAGLVVKGLVLQPLASSYAVLEPEEKELGVVLVDIGGGTTDVAIFYNGSIRESFVIGLGGINVTNDIAFGLRTPRTCAEEIKKKKGVALTSMANKSLIEVSGVGGRGQREIKKEELANIIELRIEEIFAIVHKRIEESGFADLLPGGVVLTGGTAKMPGIDRLGEDIFGLPVKIGVPKGVEGLDDSIRDPIHATGIGLILHGIYNEQEMGRVVGERRPFNRFIEKIKRWFAE
ncbi:MAG TPA: cell division protein FtsA [bacterium (Candidatus Stahlbacteria)]|nr:cell division protein FtsA [Candidatus Stahlbacteria bacterium]